MNEKEWTESLSDEDVCKRCNLLPGQFHLCPLTGVNRLQCLRSSTSKSKSGSRS